MDLNPDGGAVTVSTGTLEVAFQDSTVLALQGDTW
jgi:hypothetical protein